MVTSVVNIAKDHVDSWSNSLDKCLPNLYVQNVIDEGVDSFEKLITPPKEFTDWLYSLPEGPVYLQALAFVGKLFLRVALNVFTFAWNVLRAVIYFVTHPLQFGLSAMKFVLDFVERLTHPETWTKLGIGLVGGSLGQLAVGNPLSLPLLIVGLSMMVAGLAAGAILAFSRAQEGEGLKDVLNTLLNHAKAMVPALVTGFIFGLMIGGIQRAVHEANQLAQARQMADQFAAEFGGEFQFDYVIVHNGHALAGCNDGCAVDLGEITA